MRRLLSAMPPKSSPCSLLKSCSDVFAPVIAKLANQWRSERGAGVRSAPGGTCQGRQTGEKLYKKTYTHANSDYLFLLAYEERKKLAIANTSRDTASCKRRQPN